MSRSREVIEIEVKTRTQTAKAALPLYFSQQMATLPDDAALFSFFVSKLCSRLHRKWWLLRR